MTKVCKRCCVEKPIEQFSINRAAKDGRINNCKPCEVKRVAEWTAANPDKVKAWEEKNRKGNIRAALPADTTQKCRKCGAVKLLSEFHANPRNKLNVRQICIACTLEHAGKYYEENADAKRAKTAKWRKENPDLDIAYRTAYIAENREVLNEKRRQYRLDNIESERKKDRLYAKNNRAKIYAKNARRRAAETRATPVWLTWLHRAQIAEFYEIAVARQVQTEITQHVDHIVPLRGKGVRGLHVPWNLQILTWEENQRKYNKLIEART